MRNINQKERLTINEVARHLDVHVSTVWRWTSPRGVGGTRLRTFKIGGRKVVVRADLDAFLAELNADQSEPTKAKMSAARERQIAAAEARLQAAGIL